MKFFTAAFVAVFLSAVVTGAPSTLNWSPDVVFGFSNNGTVTNVNDIWVNVKCVYEVVDEVMEKSYAKHLWHDIKSRLEPIIREEWPKCLELSDVAEQDKCKINVVAMASNHIMNFIEKLFSEYRLDLVREIEAAVLSRCLKSGVFTQLKTALPDQFECLIEVLGEVSIENGLEDLWSESEPQIRLHLDNWKKCSELGSKFAVFLCNFKEGFSTYKTVTEYIRNVAATNPQVVNQFIAAYKEKCGPSEAFFPMGNLPGIDRVKCIVEAISDAIGESDMTAVWKEYQKKLETVYERLNACKNETDKWEALRCARIEIQNAFEILREFAEEVKQSNYKTYLKIKSYINQRCLQ